MSTDKATNKNDSYGKIDTCFYAETFETKNKGCFLYMHAKGKEMILCENGKPTGNSKSQLNFLGFDEESQYFKDIKIDLHSKLSDYIVFSGSLL